MASFTTLHGGDKFFPHKEALNAVHPIHGEAMFILPKHNGHISMHPWKKDSWKNDEMDDNYPYTLGEDSLRLYQLAKYKGFSDDLQFEALIFNFHKVYPPGDKTSPELSEKGLNAFDEKYVQKTRRLIKANSIMVRKAFGIEIEISEDLLDLHRDLQANVLFYMQHKSDKELEMMTLPDHSVSYNLIVGDKKDPRLDLSKKTISRLVPTDMNLVRRVYWQEFRKMKGEERWLKYGESAYSQLQNQDRNHKKIEQ